MYDINILVNGNRCKQYNYQGKIFVEAKNGSEYEIEIKNNTFNRILAVCSVDGLSVLTGEKASEEDTGYVIDSHSPLKIKGFRYSDTEWARFKFGYKMKGKTYAQSKEDGSEQNCGILGVRIFAEKLPPPPVIEYRPIYIEKNSWNPINPWHYPPYYWSSGDPNWIVDGGTTSGGLGYGSSCYNSSDLSLRDCDDISGEVKDNIKCSAKYDAKIVRSAELKPKNFDMGTEWGRKEESKVHNVEFERGNLLQSLDIYYASRESLIEMGIIVKKELKVGLPQSFPSKYAKPPKGWKGE
jgi:hypothetical protein